MEKPPLPPKYVSLHELAQNYCTCESFPFRVNVVSGYYGPSNRNTISSGDVYNIHFMKRQKVVTIRDSHNCQYSVPLNSSVQFAIVYDPDNQQVVEVKPCMFHKAAKIATAEVLPKVVCAMKAFKGSNGKSSVEENEILIVHHVQKSRHLHASQKSQLRGTKFLKVFSFESHSEKLLPYECKGYFSTEPLLIKLYLPQIVQHLPEAFPCQAILFLGDDFLQHFPRGLHSSLATMVELKTETSLIASSVIDDNEMREKPIIPLIDIPINDALSTVKVCVVDNYDAKETEKLYDYTRNAFENLDPSKLVSYKNTGSMETYVTQSLLYATFQEGSEKVGMELYTPVAAYQKMDIPVTDTKDASSSRAGDVTIYASSDEVHVYQPIDPESREPPQPYHVPDRVRSTTVSASSIVSCTISGAQVCQPSDPESMQHTTTRQMYDSPNQPTNKAQQLPAEVHPNLTHRRSRGPLLPIPTLPPSKCVQPVESDFLPSTSKESKKAPTPVSNGATGMITAITESSHIYEPIPGDDPPTPQVGPARQHRDSKKEQSVENRRFLLSLSEIQVQNLLAVMGLARYSDAFTEECITGDIFAELDEDILQRDLGVNSKIHRIRLMKVVTGKHSAQNILAGMDPYAN